MDTDKTAEPEKMQDKKPIADTVGELVVSAATVLAHSAAEAVVARVKKASRENPVTKKAKVIANKVLPKSGKRAAPKKTKSSAGRKSVGRKKTPKKKSKR
jgi:hypothetical protein